MLFYFQNLSREEIIPFVLAFMLAVVIAMSSHEYMHARVAYMFGDDTAKLSGRLTLNPLAHIDPLGLLSFILIGYGWASPVPINPLKFKKYRLGYLMVSLAGVVANLIIAFLMTGLFYFVLSLGVVYTLGTGFLLFIYYFFSISISMNLVLFFFNLIPVPPLDGFNVLNAITKENNKVMRVLKKYGFEILLIFLILTNFFDFSPISFLSTYVENAFVNFWTSIIL